MKQFVVIGLGRFGSSIATALSRKGFEVLAIDEDETIVGPINELITNIYPYNLIQ